MLRCTQYGVLHIDDEVAIKPHLQHTVGMGNPSLDPIQANAGPHLMPLRGAGGAIGACQQIRLCLPHLAIHPTLASSITVSGDGACLGKVRQVRPGR